MFVERLPQDLQQILKEYKELLDQLPPNEAAARVASYVPRIAQKMATDKAREIGGKPADYLREAEIVAGKMYVGLSEVIGAAPQEKLQEVWNDLDRQEQELEVSRPSKTQRH